MKHERRETFGVTDLWTSLVTSLVVIVIFASWIILIPNKPKLVFTIFFGVFAESELRKEDFLLLKEKVTKRGKRMRRNGSFCNCPCKHERMQLKFGKICWLPEGNGWFDISWLPEYCVSNLLQETEHNSSEKWNYQWNVYFIPPNEKI